MHWGTFSAQTRTEKDQCGWPIIDDECAAQIDSHNAYDISSAPLNSDGLERRISGKAPRPRGWPSQTRSTGSRTANSLASWTDKDCHASCAITFGPHRRCPLWKKVWSPTCPLNGSFQSPNCPLKGFFTRQTGFLVANGRMAADFRALDIRRSDFDGNVDCESDLKKNRLLPLFVKSEKQFCSQKNCYGTVGFLSICKTHTLTVSAPRLYGGACKDHV